MLWKRKGRKKSVFYGKTGKEAREGRKGRGGKGNRRVFLGRVGRRFVDWKIRGIEEGRFALRSDERTYVRVANVCSYSRWERGSGVRRRSVDVGVRDEEL